MICNRAEILTWIRLVTTVTDADDGLLNLIHPMAEQAIKRWMQQNLERATHVEYLPRGTRQVDEDRDLVDYDFRDSVVELRARSNVGRDFLQLTNLPVINDSTLEVREDLNAKSGQDSSAYPDNSILTKGTDYWADVDRPTGQRRVL